MPINESCTTGFCCAGFSKLKYSSLRLAMLNLLCPQYTPSCQSLIPQSIIISPLPPLETRWIHPLTNPRPLWQFYDPPKSALAHPFSTPPVTPNYQIRDNSLCIPFRYLFSFRSNIVYLSLGTISPSLGISSFHRSTAFVVSPFLASALSTVAMTASTARRRLRWRAFWGEERRQGIFLEIN